MQLRTHLRPLAHCVLPLVLTPHYAIWSGENPRCVSHPATRPIPAPRRRPMTGGPSHFVDAARGDDANPGTEAAPWRTISHAFQHLDSGDTLYLRGGVHFERLYCAVVGRPDAPITIRSYPGEQAIIDGGIPDFQRSPSEAWESCSDAASGEYRSTERYRNIRDVVGLFADSNVGLQTYWHAIDLRAKNELWMPDPDGKFAVAPVYCGPGLWYDRATGYIHCRLAHTHIDNPAVQNYGGETDPRRVPLVIAPFAASPLTVDLAKHVHFQDLIFRGGGYRTINLAFGVGIVFDNCTIFGGTYCVWAKNTGPLKMLHCGVHGNIPPWAFATENGLRTYTPRYYDPFLRDTLATYCPPPYPPYSRKNPFYREKPYDTALRARNIARLNAHALLVTEGGYEFETFYYPLNHDWEIAYCEFTDGHDGVYPAGRSIRFHHNWVDNIQDDGIYLSNPHPYIADEVHVYQNLITRTASAFGLHSRGGPAGDVYVYRNIVDLRRGVHRRRPTPKNPAGDIRSLQVFLKHGYGLLGVESLYWYHNTFVSPATVYKYVHATYLYTTEETKRRVLNNLCVYLGRWPHTRVVFERAGLAKRKHDIQIDGNLHWCPDPNAEVPTDLLEVARTCEASQFNREKYPPGWAASSMMADPKLVGFSVDADAVNDYRLRGDSPAVGQGVVLPGELDDPFRPKGDTRPDIGALPLGADALRVGRYGRILAGTHGPGK